jgi:hypothetical protein
MNPTPQDNKELGVILATHLPLHPEDEDMPGLVAKLLAWRSKYAREVATKAIGDGEDDNVPNYLGGGKNPVVQTRNELRTEQHQTLDNLLQEQETV